MTPVLRPVFALCAGSMLCAPAAGGQPVPGSPGTVVSDYVCASDAGASTPAIERLRSAVDAGQEEAARALVRCLSEAETPVVEPAGNDGRYRVTFPYVADPGTRSVRLVSNIVAARSDYDGEGDGFDALGRMDRVDGTHLWIVSMELPGALRAPYRFEVEPAAGDPALVLDPRNPRVYEDHWTANFRKSELALPSAPAQPWRARGERHGEWTIEEVAGREVAVYLPRGATPGPGPAIVALGTMTFYNVLPTGRLIDHLVEEGEIAPPIVVTFDMGERAEESRYRGEAAFVADTLLPWARSRWPISTDPEDVIVTGTSRRGLAATIAALERPDAIGRALSLSGSFYWRPEGEAELEWLARRVAGEPRRDVRLYLTAGTLETAITPTNEGHALLATNRHLRDVLTAKGYDIVYREFVGVHDEMNWQSALADGLRALIPAP